MTDKLENAIKRMNQMSDMILTLQKEKAALKKKKNKAIKILSEMLRVDSITESMYKILIEILED